LGKRHRGEGTGFSSEIETLLLDHRSRELFLVARELASHLRLKHSKNRIISPLHKAWRGNWLLI